MTRSERSGIEIKDVSMAYGKNAVLNNISLKLESGKIYGLLGRNGAGKTTLINIITNRQFQTSGQVSVDGQSVADNDEAMGKIYTMSEKSYAPEETKVIDLFRFAAIFYESFDMEYAKQLAGRFNLSLKKQLRKLSTGYGTIAKLIAALASGAPYVILDEPVLGLDANHRDMFYTELLENYGKNPRTFILSTHLISEVSGLLEHVVILHKKKILLDSPMDEVAQMGCSISGRAGSVDQIVLGHEKIGEQNLGGLKTVWIMGALGEDEIAKLPADVEVNMMDLQQMFIRLTNSQEVKYDEGK